MAKTEQNGAWVVSFDGWKMKDKRAFNKAMNEVTVTGDEGAMYPFFAQVIKKWPCDLDPSKVESYDELEPKFFQEATNHVTDAIKSWLA